MENMNIRWGLFVLGLSLVHFGAATTLLKLLGISQPLVLLVGGALWLWFLMPKVNAWMVKNTPFGGVWEWAKRGIR